MHDLWFFTLPDSAMQGSPRNKRTSNQAISKDKKESVEQEKTKKMDPNPVSAMIFQWLFAKLYIVIGAMVLNHMSANLYV